MKESPWESAGSEQRNRGTRLQRQTRPDIVSATSVMRLACRAGTYLVSAGVPPLPFHNEGAGSEQPRLLLFERVQKLLTLPEAASNTVIERVQI